MSQVCVIILATINCVLGYPGETLMIMPPFEVRTLDKYPHTQQFHGFRGFHDTQPILHTNLDQKHRNTENKDFIDTRSDINMVLHKEKNTQVQPVSYLLGRDSNESAYRPNPGAYSGSYIRPSSTPYVSPIAYNMPTVPVPTAPALPTLPIIKPDMSPLFKPVSTKVSSKVGGLLGVILSLLSGSTSGIKLTGLKDVLVNGVIQPLLAAKIGIKSLIAKLAIPVIALILINLEVLVTVWWLWDDCPAEKPPTLPSSR